MTPTEPLDPLFDEFPPTSTEAWEEKIREDLRGKDYEAMLVWDALEGVAVQPYYRSEDLADLAHVDLDAEVPPLASGESLPANQWAVRQDIAHPNLDEALRLARLALDRGATDLGVLTDVRGERVTGVPLQTIDDIARLLTTVNPTETPLHLSGGPAAPILLAFLLARARERSLDASALRGSVHYDSVAVLARGSMQDPDVAFALGTDLARRATDFSDLRTWAVSAKPYHDAGASIVQELTYVLGALSESLAQFMRRDVPLETAVRGLHFVVPVSTRYFLEIAKLRALRLLVPQVVDAFAEKSGADVTLSPEDVFIQAVTSQRSQTTYGAHVNMLRGTTEAMAAVIGGCDVLSVAPFDATFRDPGDFSERIARNTQLILREEAHADHVADPAAGSYYVEAVTDQLARKAWSAFQSLEADGGILAALQAGTVQSAIAEVRQKRLDDVENRDRVLVATNHYPDLTESRYDDLSTDDSYSEDSSSQRDASPDESAGAPLRWSPQSVDLDAPTLENLVDAARDGATLGDLIAALRGDGLASPTGASAPARPAENPDGDIDPLPQIRLGSAFDDLRLRTERYAEKTGHAPVVVLAPLGHPAMRSARSNFARNFFGVAGFDVVENLRFDTPEDAVDAAAGDHADVLVLCSSDAEYPDLASRAKEAMADADLDALLVVAGNPDKIDGDVPADGFVHLGSPLLQTLQDYQDRLFGDSA